MQIRFWGVRGSIAAPGPHTARVGGNTSCVELRCGDARFVLDAGTGLRVLGNELRREMPVELRIFLSHTHWDHIQGLPFLTPIFVPGNRIHLYGAATAVGSLREAISAQMRAPHFPVSFEELPSTVEFHQVVAGTPLDIGDVRVRAAPGHHPGGVLAYRFDHAGHSVVYATDTEHHEGRIDSALLELSRGADVLIYDAMYTPEQYDGRHDGVRRVGWGHSTFVEGAALAKAAQVDRYVLFHHDPEHDDDFVDAKELAAKQIFARSVAAREGTVIEL